MQYNTVLYHIQEKKLKEYSMISCHSAKSNVFKPSNSPEMIVQGINWLCGLQFAHQLHSHINGLGSVPIYFASNCICPLLNKVHPQHAVVRYTLETHIKMNFTARSFVL